MKAIYDFLTIQVELTNACVHSCSNCTRFCGHHKKPFFMDWDTFKRAVDSLKDWPRQIGIMGGEPTLHPEFERFVEYACKVHPEPYQIGGGKKPVKSLSCYIQDVNDVRSNFVNKYRGVALWSSVCATYAQHYEFIQDNFIFQCVNDHTASSRHQAWLMTRKEFGIGDSDWIKMRDNCWWQKLLNSPSITPKGAFFCEVAAAMDMLFDGPGGWKIEKDWWRRDPNDYKDQLFWCEYCSGAFCDLERDANEGVDDVSPLMQQKLLEIQSPKALQGKTVVHSTDSTTDVNIRSRQEVLMYQDDFSMRVTEKNKFITPQDASYFIMGHDSKEELALKEVLFDGEGSIKIGEQSICVDKFGKLLIQWINESKGWICIFENETEDKTQYVKVQEVISKTTFNPGVLHYLKEFSCWLLNTRAKFLKTTGRDGISRITDIVELSEIWDSDKFFRLDSKFEESINPDIDEWNWNITTNGLMRFYQLHDKFESVAFRSVTVPLIEKALLEEDLFKKLKKLSEVDSKYKLSHLMCSKVKTAIHNAISFYLKDHSIEELRGAFVARESLNFCDYYAIAMVSSGEEKRQALLKCIADEKNEYGLGVTTYLNELKFADDNNTSVIDEITRMADKSIVILGNRYAGKSVHMMLDHYGEKPVAICDIERHGYTFNGTMTYRPRDIVKEFSDAKLIMCLCDAEENAMKESLRQEHSDMKIERLTKATFIEMLSCAYLSDSFLGELKGVVQKNPEDFIKLSEFLKSKSEII